MTQTQVQATYLETLPIKGALPGLKDVYALAQAEIDRMVGRAR